MASAQGNHLGITHPISLAEPTDKEIEYTANLRQCLQAQDAYEAEGSMTRREEIVKSVENLLKEWVANIGSQKNILNGQEEAYGARLLTYGGQKLGVVSKDGDIDALCLVPQFVDRTEFFDSFFPLLKKQRETTQGRAIEGAYVPVINLIYNGIEIDLCMARVKKDSISSDLDIDDITLLEEMDVVCVRSVRGVMESAILPSLVPNNDHFKEAYKVIKLWAKCNNIHNAAVGFPGGIAWAIMVARVCQLYPNAAVATLVEKFFTIFLAWPWPSPVLLKQQEEDSLDLEPWNPKTNSADGYHVMPVITPAYPEKNCAFTVTKSTLAVVIQCLATGAELTEKILQGKATWENLFIRANFFLQYKHFIMITAKASTEQAHLDWSGLVAAKLRSLVLSVEQQPAVKLVCPLSQSWPPLQARTGVHLTRYFIGLSFDRGQVRLDLARDIKDFNQKLLELAKNRRIYVPGMKMEAKYLKRRELDQYLSTHVLGAKET